MIVLRVNDLFRLLKSTMNKFGMEWPSIAPVRLIETLLSLVPATSLAKDSGLTLAMLVPSL